jgi:competence protein ComEA
MKASTLLLLLSLTGGCWTKPYERESQVRHTAQSECINLNTANVEQLKELPGVGEVLARRIVDYRRRNNRFRRAEDIIIIEGFSERKYRAIADRICVE